MHTKTVSAQARFHTLTPRELAAEMPTKMLVGRQNCLHKMLAIWVGRKAGWISYILCRRSCLPTYILCRQSCLSCLPTNIFGGISAASSRGVKWRRPWPLPTFCVGNPACPQHSLRHFCRRISQWVEHIIYTYNCKWQNFTCVYIYICFAPYTYAYTRPSFSCE